MPEVNSVVWWEEREFRGNFTELKLRFSNLALHSRKQQSMKREEMKGIENCVMVLFGPLTL